ncbi:MAG TPA: PQQ-dependent dehydrogenase, methanol/ethanol family [Bryobacteraceae bacterium]|nr:PQQ-dependent dehydrogenase, methanol/ethanol family [Bryobacteraceae bacterium]
MTHRLALVAAALAASLPAQVTYERLLNAQREPGNWLTYSGGYRSWRYSPLDQINRDNAQRLKVKWVYQMPVTDYVETTPLVADGVMYISEPPSNVVALDAETGRQFWRYRRVLPSKINVCCGRVNRGVAILGDRVFVGTVDAHLVALDAKTGDVLWDVQVADSRTGYAITVAPLVVKDMVICGISGGEYGIRGFLDAYDAKSGRRRWRFWTIPEPGQPGSETWQGSAWKTGGGPTWVTGSFDVEQNLIIWGTGNPSPDWNGDSRPGDNLYTDSAIALDADTGKLKWYYQFVPHDVHDWDAVQVPVLVDDEWQGKAHKLIYWAHRCGFYYVLDRETGKFLLGKPFATQTWAKGLDEGGRPIRLPDIDPTPQGTILWPGVQGATNWYSPSYHPGTKLFYLAVWENRSLYHKGEQDYSPGNRFIGSVPLIDLPGDPGHGAIRALNPRTGDRVWEYKLHTKPWAGVLSTAGKLVFGGSDEGHYFALDAETGKEVWRMNTGGLIRSNGISYLSKGKQVVAIAGGSSIFAFDLGE